MTSVRSDEDKLEEARRILITLCDRGGIDTDPVSNEDTLSGAVLTATRLLATQPRQSVNDLFVSYAHVGGFGYMILVNVSPPENGPQVLEVQRLVVESLEPGQNTEISLITWKVLGDG